MLIIFHSQLTPQYADEKERSELRSEIIGLLYAITFKVQVY